MSTMDRAQQRYDDLAAPEDGPDECSLCEDKCDECPIHIGIDSASGSDMTAVVIVRAAVRDEIKRADALFNGISPTIYIMDEWTRERERARMRQALDVLTASVQQYTAAEDKRKRTQDPHDLAAVRKLTLGPKRARWQ